MDDQHKLGLPFEYQQMPEYFDAHNVSKETESKNALIEKLLKELGYARKKRRLKPAATGLLNYRSCFSRAK